MAKRNRTSYKEKEVKKSVSKEIGFNGIPLSGGKRVIDDTIAPLRGTKKIKLLEEMVNFDPIIGAFNNMYLSIASSVTWNLKAKDDTEEAQNVKDFVQQCLFEDLDGTFEEMVQNALTACTYGYSIIEPVYKIRKGENKNNSEKTSKYNDGKIGISKFAPRYQGSIIRWNYDEETRKLETITQRNPNTFEEVELPYDKVLHFKHRSFNNNPEGKSLYFNCVKAYLKKQNTSIQEDIRYERGFDGLLKINAPSAVLDQTTKNPQYLAVQQWIKDTLQNIKNGTDVGVALPEFIKLDILSAGSNNLPDADKIIERCDKHIATALLSDFFLTQQKAGTSGTVTSKIKIFATLVDEMLSEIVRVINHKLIPTLLRKNLIDLSLAPILNHSEISSDLDLTSIMLLLQSAKAHQLIVPTADLSNLVMKKVFGDEAPEITKEQLDEYLLYSKVQAHAYTTNQVADEFIADVDKEDNITEKTVEEAQKSQEDK